MMILIVLGSMTAIAAILSILHNVWVKSARKKRVRDIYTNQAIRGLQCDRDRLRANRDAKVMANDIWGNVPGPDAKFISRLK